MIKFFRHIRKSLIDENNMGKYIKYALGEIILVVIGILIALQINNWNTKRQDYKKGITYLNEIRTNLISDTLTIQQQLLANRNKLKSIDSCFIELASASTPANRMAALGKRFYILSTYQFFEPNSLGFSNLMSSGNIELIANDSIRKALSVYYNFDYGSAGQNRVGELTKRFIDYVDPITSTKERYLMFRNVELDLPSYNSIEIHKDPKLFSSLDLMSSLIKYQNQLFYSKENEIKTLIELINHELSH